MSQQGTHFMRLGVATFRNFYIDIFSVSAMQPWSDTVPERILLNYSVIVILDHCSVQAVNVNITEAHCSHDKDHSGGSM